MTDATLIQHLGLSEAVAQVLSKVAACPQCITFWSVYDYERKESEGHARGYDRTIE